MEHEKPPSEERYRAAMSARRKRQDKAIDLRDRKRRILDIVSKLKHVRELRSPTSRRTLRARQRAINALFVIAGPDLWEELSWAKPELFIEWVDNLKDEGTCHARA